MSEGNFKVICVNTARDDGLTKGKIYEFNNGFSFWDDGEKFPQYTQNNVSKFNSIKDLEIWLGDSNYKFEEVKEETQPIFFDWHAFKQGKIAVHCDTEEKAKQFFDELKIQGIKWNSGVEIEKYNRWNGCEDQTCYLHTDNGLTFNSLDYRMSQGKTIVPYAPSYREVKRKAEIGEWIKIINADKAPQTKGVPDYKNGDILKTIDKGFCTCFVYYSKELGSDRRAKVVDQDEYVVLELITQEPIQEPSRLHITDFSDDELLTEITRRVQDAKKN